jgi:hypothetical protein
MISMIKFSWFLQATLSRVSTRTVNSRSERKIPNLRAREYRLVLANFQAQGLLLNHL